MNGRCVVLSTGTPTTTPPAASFIADDGPDGYTQFGSCCECQGAGCPKTSCTHDVPDGTDLIATNCPAPGTGRRIRTSHTISYSRSDVYENEDFTPFDTYGGDYTTNTFIGTCSGTNVFDRTTTLSIVSQGVSHTGNCADFGSGGSGECIPMPPSDMATAFCLSIAQTANIPVQVLIPDFAQHGTPSFLYGRPAYSHHSTVSWVAGDGLWRVSTLDIEWTASFVHTCELYLYVWSCTLTHVRETRGGGVSPGALLRRETRTFSLDATMQGIIVCASPTQVTCCQCPASGLGLLAMAPVSAGGFAGLISKATGARRLAGFMRR